MAELAGRMQVEQAFSNRLGLWTDRHKEQLVNLLGDPPDWSKVTDEFWNRVEEEMKTELAIVLLIFSASARMHGDAQPLALIGLSLVLRALLPALSLTAKADSIQSSRER